MNFDQYMKTVFDEYQRLKKIEEAAAKAAPVIRPRAPLTASLMQLAKKEK